MIKLATDLDGTIYKGNKLIEGVKDSYENLIDNDVEIYFITNNSSQTPYEIKEKLEILLQSEIDINKIITPLNVLKKMFLNQTTNIYVYGSSNLKQFVESINLCLTNIDQADLILIGRKSELDLTEIELIKSSIKNGKQVLCLNKDLSFPSEDEELPGNGAVVKMIEDDLEITITSLGKPDLHFIKYCSDHNYNFDYVIGDRVDTDIFFGKQINAITILVETGVKNFESTKLADIKLKSFSEVVSFIS